ncbi:nicotinate-nucleotide pyrophosphorylase [Desulfurispora thermophila]|uniref:nicotinate-nucleotide pyrophosphorylase n=1 Tax=Desulfurispora thermophila TaxID=265470 RepID=UPI00035D1F75|nr:nicotinate-nucleotide pyrophosphorylase [Desulfurispora thermophila]
MEKHILPPDDIRYSIFKGMEDHIFQAGVFFTQPAVVAGLIESENEANSLGLEVRSKVREGMSVLAGQAVLTLIGPALALAVAEDRVLGWIGKASGVATAARSFREMLPDRIRVVCGGWKKLPLSWRHNLRRAAAVGGVATRIVDDPFIYLDKNYIRMFGGITGTLQAVASLPGEKVIQLRGEWGDITEEAAQALINGATVLMVDTGCVEDVTRVAGYLHGRGWRHRVRLAFSGGIKREDLSTIAALDVDIIDIGRSVLDAPMTDLRFDVLGPA